MCTVLSSLLLTGRDSLATNVPSKERCFPRPHPFDQQQETAPKSHQQVKTIASL